MQPPEAVETGGGPPQAGGPVVGIWSTPARVTRPGDRLRVARTAAALGAGGTLAVIGTHYIAGGDSQFFAEVQSCYERWDPSTPPGLQLPRASEIPRDSTELDESGLFEPAVFRRYEWTERYSAAAYRDLLLTYSSHRALESAQREQLLDCITHLIEGRYSGRITKRYLTELRLTHRRAAE